MRQRKLREPSTRHEPVYHAAPRCQAASLPLTVWRLHGLFKACQIEGQKTGACFASQESARTARLEVLPLGSGLGVQPLSRFKDAGLDRKSTRLNSSHVSISYAVFCLK